MTDPAHDDAMELPRHEPPETLDIDRMQRIAARLREDAAERRGYLRGLEEAARIADRCADDDTKAALGANAAINASQIAHAIRALMDKEPPA